MEPMEPQDTIDNTICGDNGSIGSDWSFAAMSDSRGNHEAEGSLPRECAGEVSHTLSNVRLRGQGLIIHIRAEVQLNCCTRMLALPMLRVAPRKVRMQCLFSLS